MECRKLEITLVSANNLPNIRSIGMMEVYARVSVKGEPKTTQKTPVDTRGETNPRWNFPVQFTISESSLRQPGVTVMVKLMCNRSLGDKLVGEVNIEVKNLFELGLKADKILSYGVVGTTKGRLNVLYSFGEKVVVKRPSGWRSAVEVGFFLVVGGALILLGRESDGGDEKVGRGARVHDVDEFEDDEVFYDAIGD
ncbi:hypothetical protein ACS0TY_028287 [Phlomoides rotata]